MTYTITIERPDDLSEFRHSARRLLAANVPPDDVVWTSEPTGTLFPKTLPGTERITAVPRSFSELATAVICHRDDRCWALLYAALWRIDRGERLLMANPSDPLVHRLRKMEAAIRRDQHRMTAFVRFRVVTGPAGEHYVAWYEPQHRILRRAASFFIDRFANMRFSILTPDLSLHWDQQTQTFSPGLQSQDAISEDKVEDWWRHYYAAVFNPARTNAGLMQSHMPKRFWHNLPEATLIPELIASAGGRTDQMIQRQAGTVSAKPLF